jgi:hypothetical protein
MHVIRGMCGFFVGCLGLTLLYIVSTLLYKATKQPLIWLDYILMIWDLFLCFMMFRFTWQLILKRLFRKREEV